MSRASCSRVLPTLRPQPGADETVRALGDVLEEMEATVRFLPCK